VQRAASFGWRDHSWKDVVQARSAYQRLKETVVALAEAEEPMQPAG